MTPYATRFRTGLRFFPKAFLFFNFLQKFFCRQLRDKIPHRMVEPEYIQIQFRALKIRKREKKRLKTSVSPPIFDFSKKFSGQSFFLGGFHPSLHGLAEKPVKSWRKPLIDASSYTVQKGEIQAGRTGSKALLTHGRASVGPVSSRHRNLPY